MKNLKTLAFVLMLGLVGCNEDPKAAGDTIDVTRLESWSTFGSGSKEVDRSTGGTILRNMSNTGFASAAVLFGDGLEANVRRYLVLRVRGVNGARQLGITTVFAGDNPNTISGLNAEIHSLSDQSQVIVYELPRGDKKISQIALHFGSNFATVGQLGNPANAGVVIEQAVLSPTPTLPSRNSTPIAGSSLSTMGIAMPKVTPRAAVPNLPAASKGTPVIVESDVPPTRYVPVSQAIVERNGRFSRFGENTAEVHPAANAADK